MRTHDNDRTVPDDWFKPNGRPVVFYCGAQCSKCKATANVAEMGGWSCACGEFNMLSIRGGGNEPPHDHPDQGPTSATIVAAMRQHGLCS